MTSIVKCWFLALINALDVSFWLMTMDVRCWFIVIVITNVLSASLANDNGCQVLVSVITNGFLVRFWQLTMDVSCWFLPFNSG